MGSACSTCLGRSWTIVDDRVEPCPTCKPDRADALRAFEVSEALKRPAPTDTFSYIDGPTPKNAPPNSAAMDAVSAGVATQEQVDKQNALDLQAAIASGIGRKK